MGVCGPPGFVFQNWLDPTKEMKKQIRSTSVITPNNEQGKKQNHITLVHFVTRLLVSQPDPGTLLLMSSSIPPTPPSCLRTSHGEPSSVCLLLLLLLLLFTRVYRYDTTKLFTATEGAACCLHSIVLEALCNKMVYLLSY